MRCILNDIYQTLVMTKFLETRSTATMRLTRSCLPRNNETTLPRLLLHGCLSSSRDEDGLLNVLVSTFPVIPVD